jgi:hypothetical protein
MIELDINKPRNFKFDVSIDGINSDILTGFLRLEINNIEYGFPAIVTNESVSADIPALKNIVKREIKSGDKIKARLDVTGDGYYMDPWHEDIVVKSSVVIEAKLVESDKPVISIKESKKEIKKEVKVAKENFKPLLKEPEIDKEFIFRYMERNGTKSKEIQNLLYEQASMKLGDNNRDLMKFFITFYKKNSEKLKNEK